MEPGLHGASTIKNNDDNNDYALCKPDSSVGRTSE